MRKFGRAAALALAAFTGWITPVPPTSMVLTPPFTTTGFGVMVNLATAWSGGGSLVPLPPPLLLGRALAGFAIASRETIATTAPTAIEAIRRVRLEMRNELVIWTPWLVVKPRSPCSKNAAGPTISPAAFVVSNARQSDGGHGEPAGPAAVLGARERHGQHRGNEPQHRAGARRDGERVARAGPVRLAEE